MAPGVSRALARLDRREHWVGEDDLAGAGGGSDMMGIIVAKDDKKIGVVIASDL